MADSLTNLLREREAAATLAQSRMALTLANMGAGDALSMQGSGNVEQSGIFLPNPGGFNGELPTDDPDYDPLLETMPNAYVEFYRIGQPLGLYPLKP